MMVLLSGSLVDTIKFQFYTDCPICKVDPVYLTIRPCNCGGAVEVARREGCPRIYNADKCRVWAVD